MKKVLLFTFLCISVTLSAQWEWQNPLPQGNGLDCVHFVDSLEGWAAGGFATLMHTTDGGKNWEILSLDTGPFDYFNDIFFVSPDTGWLGGYLSGVIYKTTDGGQNWGEKELPVPVNCKSIFFISADKGWIAGSNYIILHTTDGGESWEEQDNGLGGQYGWFESVYFMNEDLGWICGWNGKILKTNTGGETWSALNSGTSEDLYSLFFMDDSHGWATGYGCLLKTTNGGSSWYAANISSSFAGRSIFFTDQLNGYACGLSGVIVQSTDGGLTWNNMNSHTGAHLEDISFSSPTHGWIVGSGGKILTYDDSQNDWMSLSQGFLEQILDACFINEEEGWICGRNLRHTTDGGNTWEYQFVASGARIECVHFVDNMNGWAAGLGDIYHTTDGGETWDIQMTGNYDTLFRDILFTDIQHGWAVDLYGLLFHTNDGGETWKEQNCGLNVQLNKICAIDPLTAWIAGGYGWVSMTGNGGEAWTHLQTGFPTSMNWDIQFIDSQHGWMVDGGILYTEDGGLHWTKIADNGGFALHFIDSDQGWICGANGWIRHTTDGGNTWQAQNRLTNAWLYDIWFDDENTGWAFGSEGAILHTDNGGQVGITPPVPHQTATPVKVRPNPSRSGFTLDYEISDPQIVILTIFDNNGRRCGEIHAGLQPAGKQQITWDAEGYPAGVYYYRLEAGEEAFSGRLVLVE